MRKGPQKPTEIERESDDVSLSTAGRGKTTEGWPQAEGATSLPPSKLPSGHERGSRRLRQAPARASRLPGSLPPGAAPRRGHTPSPSEAGPPGHQGPNPGEDTGNCPDHGDGAFTADSSAVAQGINRAEEGDLRQERGLQGGQRWNREITAT